MEMVNHRSQFVIKVEEIPAACFLLDQQPSPLSLDWINRGTDQSLRQQSVEMLMRTLSRRAPSPSVQRLRQHSGLRATFATEHERFEFAKAFSQASAQFLEAEHFMAGAAVPDVTRAEQLLALLTDLGVQKEAVSILSSREADLPGPNGGAEQSLAEVAADAGGGHVQSIVSGLPKLTCVPGFGELALMGSLASNAIPSMACLGAIFGTASRGASPCFDNEGRGSPNFADELRQGSLVMLVDLRKLRNTNAKAGTVRILANLREGGRRADIEAARTAVPVSG